MNEEVKVITEEQSDLYATEVKKIQKHFQKFLAQAIFDVFQYNFSSYLAPLLIDSGPYQLLDSKKVLKFVENLHLLNDKEFVAVKTIISKQKSSTDERYLKKVEEVLLPVFSDKEIALHFLKSAMDMQALLKSIQFVKNNFVIMKNSFRKLTEGVLKDCIATRNNFIAHDSTLAFIGWTPSKLESDVLYSFKEFVKLCQGNQSKELEQLSKQFYEQCEKSMKLIGYPPIELEMISKMVGTEVGVVKENIENTLRFTVYNQYVLGVSKEILFEEYRKRISFDELKPASTTERILEELQYLKEYTGGKLHEFQCKELFTKYNLMLDYSVLMNTNSLFYIAYELVPKLKKLKRNVLVHRSIRYQIYTQEQTFKAKLDSMKEIQAELEMRNIVGEEGNVIEFDTETYDHYCTEYERAKKARIFMDKWLHDGLIRFVGAVDIMNDGEINIMRYIKETKGYRFAIFTNQLDFAKELFSLQLPRITSLRIFAREDIFVWKDFIQNFKLDHAQHDKEVDALLDEAAQHKIIRSEEVESDDEIIEPVLEVENFKKIVFPQSNHRGVSFKKTFEISSLKYAPNDELLEIKGEIPSEHMPVFLEDGTSITLQEKLDKGGEGVIYLLEEQGYVAKIYYKHRITKQRKDKLSLMTANNPNIKELCWPTSLLYNQNQEFIGYIMPLADAGNIELGKSVMKIGNEAVRKKYCVNWTRKDLINVAYAICCVFEKMHEKNILMGDVNVRNILIYPSDSSKVCFVDCDSFQVGDFTCPVGVLEFTAPTMIERYKLESSNFGNLFRTIEDENYILAALIFQILMLGQAHYASKADTKNVIDAIKNYTFSYRTSKNSGKDVPDGPFRMIWSNTAKSVKDAFEEVFTGEKTYSAREWKQKLNVYLRNTEKGNYTEELTPNKFFTKGFEDEFMDYTCEYCGKVCNMSKTRYEYKMSRNHIMTCNGCQIVDNLLMKQECTLVCDRCKTKFRSNRFQKMLKDERGRRVLCNSCK